MISISNYGDVKFVLMGKSLLGRPVYTTGVYYLDGLLIDSGPANSNSDFSAVYRNLAAKELVNTHYHEDHTGNNLAISQQFGLIPKIHSEGIEKITHRQTELDLYRRITWGIPEPSPAEAVGDIIKAGKYELEVIHTPGHSPDHICLFENKEKWLFTGDLYLGSKMKLLEKSENIYQMISSLKKVLSLQPEIIYCSHRGKMGNAKKLLSDKIINLEKLMDKVMSLYNKGMSINEITSKLFPGDISWRIFSNGHLSGRNLISAIINQKNI